MSRFLSSVSGTDKALMLIQYFVPVINFSLRQIAIRGSSLEREKYLLQLVEKLKNLAAPVSDTRILLRFWGLLPIFQWAISLYNTPVKKDEGPAPTSLSTLKTLRKIEWIQVFANLCYYPLEHTYYLAAHNVLSISPAKRDAIGVWSCRFWATHVVLQILSIQLKLSDHRRREALLRMKLINVHNEKAHNEHSETHIKAAVSDLHKSRAQVYLDTIIQAGYLPLTMHWSLETGILSEVMVGVFGSLAAVTQTYAAIKAAAKH